MIIYTCFKKKKKKKKEKKKNFSLEKNWPEPPAPKCSFSSVSCKKKKCATTNDNLSHAFKKIKKRKKKKMGEKKKCPLALKVKINKIIKIFAKWDKKHKNLAFGLKNENK